MRSYLRICFQRRAARLVSWRGTDQSDKFWELVLLVRIRAVDRCEYVMTGQCAVGIVSPEKCNTVALADILAQPYQRVERSVKYRLVVELDTSMRVPGCRYPKNWKSRYDSLLERLYRHYRQFCRSISRSLTITGAVIIGTGYGAKVSSRMVGRKLFDRGKSRRWGCQDQSSSCDQSGAGYGVRPLSKCYFIEK